LAAHPLKVDEIVQVVLTAWDELHSTRIGHRKLRIGIHIFPNPQIIGFLLHEVIPGCLRRTIPENGGGKRRRAKKTSIFGNRSYAQKPTTKSVSRKTKSGYFLTVNFVPFKPGTRGKITKVRFGWLDHTDWIGQKAPTGQQSRLTAEADRFKLMELYSDAGTSSKAG